MTSSNKSCESIKVFWNPVLGAKRYFLTITNSLGYMQAYVTSNPAMDFQDLKPSTNYTVTLLAGNDAGNGTERKAFYRTGKEYYVKTYLF